MANGTTTTNGKSSFFDKVKDSPVWKSMFRHGYADTPRNRILQVSSNVFLHMSRVFYHGAYKAPREFNWVIGVILLTLTLLLSFTGYLFSWDQLVLWAVTVGTNMMGYTPVFGSSVKFVLLGSKEISNETLLRWYTLHVLLLPFVIVIFMAVHFWRVRKDGGLSGPL